MEIDEQRRSETIVDDPLEKIKKALADRNLARVAAATKLHENTVRAIAAGKNTNPTLETLNRLNTYLFG
jgi:ribosome-binding protein aMBF1 (putative translation factor)